jgi:CubicO group peptidase (beta-lactamase class C family)
LNGHGGGVSSEVSSSSFGHTGFTGTIVWADPKEDLVYVFLSNRVYPSAENWKIVSMNVRTEIQKVIYKTIMSRKK